MMSERIERLRKCVEEVFDKIPDQFRLKDDDQILLETLAILSESDKPVENEGLEYPPRTAQPPRDTNDPPIAELKTTNNRIKELESAESAAIEPMQDSIDFLTAENERLKEALVMIYKLAESAERRQEECEQAGGSSDQFHLSIDRIEKCARQALAPDHIVDANKKVETTEDKGVNDE